MDKQENAVIEGLSVRAKKGTWVLSRDLSISGAEQLHSDAVHVLHDSRIKQLKIELPEGGVPLPTFQVLKSLEIAFQQESKEISFTHGLCLHGEP